MRLGAGFYPPRKREPRVVRYHACFTAGALTKGNAGAVVHSTLIRWDLRPASASTSVPWELKEDQGQRDGCHSPRGAPPLLGKWETPGDFHFSSLLAPGRWEAKVAGFGTWSISLPFLHLEEARQRSSSAWAAQERRQTADVYK